MYDFAHVWIPKKSLMRERYAAALGHNPRVLFGLSQSWEPMVHEILSALEVNSIVFSPDGSHLALWSYEEVQIWNTSTGELEDDLECHEHSVMSVAFSHNDRFIVSGSVDVTIQIWNTATCETIYVLTSYKDEVTSAAISGNDKFVVSGSEDGTVRIWDTAAGELLHVLEGHGLDVYSVVVSPDCQHIASVSLAHELWIWTKDGILEHKLEIPANEILSDHAFSNDGRRILCNVNRMEWTTTGHRLSPPDINDDPGDAGRTRSVAYSPDDNEIVYGMKDGEVIIWNRDTNKAHILGRHGSGVTSVAFSPNGSRIASGSSDGTVKIWDPRLREVIDEEASLEGLRMATLSHDGGWIVTASESLCHIQVWRVTETVTKANNELITEGQVQCLALSRDGSRVVICAGGSICVWNHLTNTTECQMSGHSDSVTCVAFSYDERHLVSGSEDKTVRMWDCHTGNEISMLQHTAPVQCVAFSRDGCCVAIGVQVSRQARIWNPSTGEVQWELDRPPERAGPTSSVAFSHDDSHVISASWNGVWLWNLRTGESTGLPERGQLPDGTRAHFLGVEDFHVYDPVDQETINHTLPYLLSISEGLDWIIGEQVEHNCWIPPQYRNFCRVFVAKSGIVCLGYELGRMIVLDLKSTQGI